MMGLFKQEFKSLFKSPASLSILIIPVVMMIGLGFLLPSAWIVPSAITIGIVASVLLYFGGSIEEVKRTSFMKSISLTRLNKFSYLATKILFSVLISFFSVLWVLFFAWFFTDVVDFLAHDFGNLIPAGSSGPINVIRTIPFEVNWSNIHWVTMFYAGIMTIVVSISISFIFVTFSKSSLSFYLMSFGYLLGMILFGGVVMPSFLISQDNDWFKNLYYLIPNYFTNNMMAASFGNSIGGTIHGVTNSLNVLATHSLDKVEAQNISSAFNIWFKNADATEHAAWWINNGTFGNANWSITSEGISVAQNWAIENGYNLDAYNLIVNDVNVISALPISDWTSVEWSSLGNILGVIDTQGIFGIIISSWWHSFDQTTWALSSNDWNSTIVDIVKNINSFYGGIVEGALKLWGPGAAISYVIPLIGTFGNGYAQSIYGLTEILDSMFKSPKLFNFTDLSSALDVLIPWVETILFVGISTTFFKWS